MGHLIIKTVFEMTGLFAGRQYKIGGNSYVLCKWKL